MKGVKLKMANKTTTKAIKTFNAVRSISTKSFREIVPNATEQNISAIANILLNDN